MLPRYGKLFLLTIERKKGIKMSESISDKMVIRLRDMQAAASDIIASAVISVDGLAMASALPTNVEEDRVAAMSAAMLSLGERIASELGRGDLNEVPWRRRICTINSNRDRSCINCISSQRSKTWVDLS